MNSKKESILIIGNGFDIDLGLATSYRDFAKSTFWPFSEPLADFNVKSGLMPKSIHDLMHYDLSSSSWFDIEASLGKYATLNGSYRDDEMYNYEHEYDTAKNDLVHYKRLVKSLTDYLDSVQNLPVNKESTAAKILRAIAKSSHFSGIFSFNYTDLNRIASEIGVTEEFWYTHMHGDLKTGIILGIENNMDFFPGYRYLCKEYNPNYATRFLSHRLDLAHEIVFFGHSLSKIDYHYFSQFFAKQSNPELPHKDAKVITIFTRNNESRMDILDQLRAMNNKRLDHLYGKNYFHIICTDGSEEMRVGEFLNHIDKLDNPTIIHSGIC